MDETNTFSETGTRSTPGYFSAPQSNISPQSPNKKSTIKKWAFGLLIVCIPLGYIAYTVKKVSHTLNAGLDSLATQAQTSALKKQAVANIDMKMVRNLSIVRDVAEKYRIMYGSYKGFSFDAVRADNFYTTVNEKNCNSRIHLDIAPDGSKYIAYYPNCFDEKRSSLCVQNGMEKGILADTSVAQKEYRCEAYQDSVDRFGELDKRMFSNTITIWEKIERYRKEHGTYQGFTVGSINEPNFSVKSDAPGCSNEIRTEIFEGGESYRLTYPLCLDARVVCIDGPRDFPSLVPAEILSRSANQCR